MRPANLESKGMAPHRLNRLSAFSRRRRGFTMMELLIAASITAIVAGAAAAMASAMSNAATQTTDMRNIKTAGHYALWRIMSALRTSRAVGQVTPNLISLWRNDRNGDDAVQLYESAIIRYDPTTKRISYEYLEETSGPMPTTTVTSSDFTDAGVVASLITGSDKKTIVWAEDTQSLAFNGYPSNVSTRIVETRFTMGTEARETAFQGTASPRATGDYLFASDTNNPPLPGSSRKVRKSPSTFPAMPISNPAPLGEGASQAQVK